MSKRSFAQLNESLTRSVVTALERAGAHQAVVAEAPPGAGKSTLTTSVARALVDADPTEPVAVVTQTNEQADDLVTSLVRRFPALPVARIVGGSGPSDAMNALRVAVAEQSDAEAVRQSRVIVSTARKWQYERSRAQDKGTGLHFRFALVDEAYQMRSDALLGIAELFSTLFCVGDPGQLDPFTVVDDSLWKGLPYSPARTALGTLRAFHPDVQPIRMPTSWRLPPSAARVVSDAFYPLADFDAGSAPEDRRLELGSNGRSNGTGDALAQAAATGWAYVELAESFTPRTDLELATTLAHHVKALLERGATVVDELHPNGVPLDPARVAVIAAHNDQVHAVRHALTRAGQDPNALVVSTANKIQGREYDVVFVWHPLAGRRDATTFHLESGRMCVMLSRHRHACVVFGRAGADRLLEEFPDSDPVYLDEPEKFPDGWEANHRVLRHLQTCRV